MKENKLKTKRGKKGNMLIRLIIQGTDEMMKANCLLVFFPLSLVRIKFSVKARNIPI